MAVYKLVYYIFQSFACTFEWMFVYAKLLCMGYFILIWYKIHTETLNWKKNMSFQNEMAQYNFEHLKKGKK